MQSQVYTAAIHGIRAVFVLVETDVSRGLPLTKIIGLGDTTVKEAASRVRSAIISSGFEYPISRITINLSPAWLHKKGSHIDLSMAIGILSASSYISQDELKNKGFLGELALNGMVRPCKGILPMVEALREVGINEIFLPEDNVEEARLMRGINVIGVSSLEETMSILQGKKRKETCRAHISVRPEDNGLKSLDFKDIKGQEDAKRAICVAISGGHHLMIVGSPGTGKSMIAERMPYIMPPLSEKEMLELTSIYSVSGLLGETCRIIRKRPFRRPQVGITAAGMMGAGYPPRPGEITLAHHGVLFLDEFTEMDRNVIEALRIPIDVRQINLVKRGESFIYPADFMLVLSANPCKCGYYGDDRHECTCTSYDIARYRSKFTGPLIDRIDIQIALRDPGYSKLTKDSSMSSCDMKKVVEIARSIQLERFGNKNFLNAYMSDRDIWRFCKLDSDCEKLAREAYDNLGLNPRGLMKAKKLARTIADMEESEFIKTEHLAEALMYRKRPMCSS